MAKKLSPPRPNPKSRKPAQPRPMDRPPNVKYTEESRPMALSEAMRYFSSSLVKEFRVNNGVFCPKGHEGTKLGESSEEFIDYIVLVSVVTQFLRCRDALVGNHTANCCMHVCTSFPRT